MNTIQARIKTYLSDRNWDTVAPGDIAKSISIEAAELLEVFQWDNPTSEDVIRDAKKLHEIKSELADVMIYCLNLTVILGLDVDEIILNKVAHNEAKYPAHLMKQPDSDDMYQKIKREYRRKERGM